MNVSVIGAGYVGAAVGEGLKAFGHDVLFYDVVAKSLEPFTHDLEHATKSADVIFVCVPTPTTAEGRIDLSIVESVCSDIGRYLDNRKFRVVAIKSTIIPQTTIDLIIPLLERCSGLQVNKDFGVCTNPEFLTQNDALHDFLNADRIVIGESGVQAGQIMEDLYKPLGVHIFHTTPTSAEMVKYVSNSFLAAKISFFNEIGLFCSLLHEEPEKICHMAALDHRIGSYGSVPGTPFGGACLPKDLEAFITFLKSFMQPQLLCATRAINKSLVHQSKPIDCSVVVSAHRPDEIYSLLTMLRGQTFKNRFEVIVVIDGIDGIARCIKTFEAIDWGFPLRVVTNPKVGCQTARNVGINEAKGGIIAFTDDDCTPNLNWLEKGYSYFKNDESVVGVEGTIYSDPPLPLFTAYNSVETTSDGVVRYGKTANMFYRKDVLESVGGFDEMFTIKSSRGFIGFRGDTDLAWRVERHGKVVFAEDVLVYHPIRPITVRKLLQETKLYKNSALLLRNHPDRMVDVLKLNFIPSRMLAIPLLPFKAFWFSVGLIECRGGKNAYCANPC